MERPLLAQLEVLARGRTVDLDACDDRNAISNERELEAANVTIEQLETAVEHRTVLGQASGIIMERFGLGADEAFDVLAKLSQSTNRKVYEISCELVETNTVDGL